MADNEDKDVGAEGNLRIEIATLFSEVRIAIEALAMGRKQAVAGDAPATFHWRMQSHWRPTPCSGRT